MNWKCWFLHQWSKWVTYHVTATKLDGTILGNTDHYQLKRCERCNQIKQMGIYEI